MKRLLSSHRAKLAVSVVAIGVLSGCASVSLEQNVNRVNTETTGFTRKLPRQVDRLEVETAAVDNLGLNTTGGTLPRESCGRYSL